MIYQAGDFIDTTQGLLIVQCPITFKQNSNPKYNKLGNRTLYWMHNESYEDVFLWDNELKNILTDSEKLLSCENEGDL